MYVVGKPSLFTIDGLKFKTKPWEHQLLALKFLMQRKQAALYTDMGTGKSKVMIEFGRSNLASTRICPLQAL